MPPTPLPDLVGRYYVGADAHFLPLSTRELSRASEYLGWIFDSLAFAPGRAVLLACQFEEAAQFVPIEEALTERGLVLTNAEASVYDGSRAISVLRRFDVAGVIGLNKALLDSMIEVDADVERLLQGRVVWARPCAYDRLAQMRGVRLLRYIEVGATLALECAQAAGAHIDAREWDVTSLNGEIRLTNRLARALPLTDAATGVFAALDRSVCDCGLSDPRIRPDAPCANA